MRELAVVLGLLLLIFVAPFVHAELQTVDPSVLQEASSEGLARVIVTYNNDVFGSGVGSNAIIDREFPEKNQFALTVTSDQLNTLLSNPSVEKIALDKKISVLLQNTTTLTNASLVHRLVFNSTNITGTSTSVCVIDTGVDFTHSDLQGRNATACNVDCISNSGTCTQNCSLSDDNGHGTHVAGVVAASGSLIGMAPSTRIVAVKALDSNGSGFTSDVAAGIDWCRNNKDTYNISVISLSIGIPGYANNSVCDNADLAVDAANAAGSAGLFVAAASGNDGNTTGVTSPACGSNVTAVGSITKSFGYSSFTNRGGSHPILLSFGSSINSTVPLSSSCTGTPSLALCSNSRYATLDGTSMATPHVAGIAALFIQRYRQLHGVLPSRAYVERTLNATGIPLFDSATSRNYYAVDAYAAVSSANTPPQFNGTLSNQTLEMDNMPISISIAGNVTDADNDVISVTTNDSNVTVNNTAKTLLFNYTSIFSNRAIVVTLNDSQNTTSQTIFVSVQDTIAPNVTVFSPANGTAYSNETVNLTATTTNVSGTTTAFFYSLNGATNQTLVSGNATFINASEGWNNVSIFANDVNNNTNSTTTQFFVDSIAPSLGLVLPSPANGSVKNENITINLSFSESNPSWAVLSFDGSANQSVNQTTMSLNYVTFTLSSLNEGMHNYSVFLNDTVGNSNQTETRTFTVDKTSPKILFNSPTPANATTTNSTNYTLTVNVSINETNLDTVTFYLNGVANQTKNSAQFSGNSSFAFVNITNGLYTYSVLVNDTAGNTNQTETRTVIIDTTSPAVTISSPSANAYLSNRAVSVIGTVSDLTNVSLAINDTARFANNAGTNTTFNYTNASLPDGTYSVLITATDSFGKSSTANVTFAVDTVNPPINITGLTSSGTTTSATTLNWTEITATDVYRYIVYRFKQSSAPNSTGGGVIVANFTATNNGTTSASISGLDSNSTYWFIVTTADRAGNENTTVDSNNRISVTTSAPPSSGTTTSQPAATAAAQTQQAQVVVQADPKQAFASVSITAGTPYLFVISEAKLDAIQISVDVTESASVSLTVEKPSTRPSETSDPAKPVYAYMKITADGLDDTKVKKAVITFKVDSSWLSGQQMTEDDVALLRYHDSAWQTLETKKISTKDGYSYYEAVTPGFSSFAISAVKKEKAELAQDTLSVDENEYVPAREKSGTPKSTLLLMALSVTVVAFGIFWLKQGRPPTRFAGKAQ